MGEFRAAHKRLTKDESGPGRGSRRQRAVGRQGAQRVQGGQVSDLPLRDDSSGWLYGMAIRDSPVG
jgi:hypothetical protein